MATRLGFMVSSGVTSNVNIGCFSVDPGGATGLAWGVFDPGAKGVAEALASKMNFGSATVTGSEREQIKEIGELWRAFYSACVRSALLSADRVFLVVEDYVYVPGVSYTGDSAKISTAIIWGLEGYRMGRRDEWREHRRGVYKMPPMVLQTASEAKGFAKPAKLKEWGLWIVGREHERSACQHLAYFMKRYMLQHHGRA